MGKVIHVVAGDLTSYVEYDFGAVSETWLQWRQAWNASAISNGFQGEPFLTDSSGNVTDGVNIDPFAPGGPRIQNWWSLDDLGPVIVANRWYTIGLHTHIVAGVITSRITVDGVDIGAMTTVGNPPGLVERLMVGGVSSNSVGDEVWVDAIKLGTGGYGSTDIFSADFESGVFVPPFTTDHSTDGGPLEIVYDPAFSVAHSGRVLIAFDDAPLEPSPTWTQIDDTDNLVAGYDLHSGKQTERDRTDTGTATLYLNDTDGLFDPMNTGSPYFGNLDGKQIMFQVWNPVTSEWAQQWRGWIDDYGYDINPATNPDGTLVVANVQVDCVDVFDYLGGYQVQPGVDGDAPPAGSEGIVFYEDTAGTVDDRIIQQLTDANIDSTRWVVFSGNVRVQETKMDPGDAILNGLRDAADAEGPFIANIYVDRFGRFVFHGRYARFDPEGVIAAGPVSTDTWDFHRWKVGDGAAIALDSDRAQVRVLSYNRPRHEIINSAICWPRGILEADIPDQVFEDATSISDYGKHSADPLTDLIISEGVTTGNTANVECAKYAELIVKNQKDPATRIKTLTIKPVPPDDPRAAATWGVLCGADISDVVNLSVGYPGGVGIQDEDYYIEGRTMRVRPLNPTYDNVELDLDISPAAQSMDTHGVFA